MSDEVHYEPMFRSEFPRVSAFEQQPPVAKPSYISLEEIHQEIANARENTTRTSSTADAHLNDLRAEIQDLHDWVEAQIHNMLGPPYDYGIHVGFAGDLLDRIRRLT